MRLRKSGGGGGGGGGVGLCSESCRRWVVKMPVCRRAGAGGGGWGCGGCEKVAIRSRCGWRWASFQVAKRRRGFTAKPWRQQERGLEVGAKGGVERGDGCGEGCVGCI